MISVTRDFTPMTIRISSKKDAELIEYALELLLINAEQGSSRWFGLYKKEPSQEEREKLQHQLRIF